MKEEKFNEIVNKYGRDICSANLRSPERNKAYLYAEENNYPYITMRHIAIKCFEDEDIVDIHKTGFYSTLKSRKKFMRILDSFTKFATSNKNELNDFINYLVGNEYNVGKGFNIRFEQNKSNLEIILEKRKK